MAQTVLSAPENALELPNDELLAFVRGGANGAEFLDRLELLFPENGVPTVNLFGDAEGDEVFVTVVDEDGLDVDTLNLEDFESDEAEAGELVSA